MPSKPYFPIKPIKLDYIYFHVGRITVNWADAEAAIDSCLRVFARISQDPLYQRPVSTKRRIVLFREQLKRLPLDKAHTVRGRQLIDRFAHLSWYRHWTTHGEIESAYILGQTWRSKKGLVGYRRNNLSTDNSEWEELHLADIEAMGDEALAIYSQLWDWIAVDLGCSTPKKTENFVRKIRMRLARKLPVR